MTSRVFKDWQSSLERGAYKNGVRRFNYLELPADDPERLAIERTLAEADRLRLMPKEQFVTGSTTGKKQTQDPRQGGGYR